MAKEFLPIFLDFNETTQDLNDEQCGRLIRALVDYANGNEPVLDGMELLAFRFMKGGIDRNEKLSAIRAEAGSKGGQASASKRKQKEANASKNQQNSINNNNNINNDNDNDNKFDRFWDAYPRKAAKPDARKKFERLNPDEELLKAMLAAIEKSKGSEQWTKDGGQYIPYPATWINQRRWEDDPPEKKISKAGFESERDYANEDAEAMRRMLKVVSS